MSDLPTESASGPDDLPEATAYMPGVDPLPVAPGERAPVILLQVGAVDRAWAAEAAIEMCTGWAAEGRRVVLADMHLENPVLHEVLGVENGEGIVDIFLYGASISRSARPVEGRGFHLITAGTYDVNTASIYRHPRWLKLVAGFREANATLVLFAPAASLEPDAVSAWVGEVILLGAPRVAGASAGAVGRSASALLVPPGYRFPEPGDPAIGVESGADSEGDDLFLPPEPTRASAPARSGAMIAVSVVLLLFLLAAAGFALARYRPDLVPWLPARDAPAEIDAAGSPSAAAPASRRAGETVPFAVLVRSYASFGAARQQVQSEQRRFEDTPFYISPENDSGVLYYKVYAGLLRDTASAERLRERLLDSGAVDADDTLGALSLIHRAHLSFDLGEFATLDSARAVEDSLAAREIPTYSVPMPYEDGSRRWQLYGGAYRDSATADALRQRLTEAGIVPRLVLRVGEPAPGAE
jgi:hypothetical protein